VLEQHGTSIACHTQPGQGTTFVLTFGTTALLLA
jgi:signal transduction histidine kinase